MNRFLRVRCLRTHLQPRPSEGEALTVSWSDGMTADPRRRSPQPPPAISRRKVAALGVPGLILCLLFSSPGALWGAATLPAWFSDGMVLQRTTAATKSSDVLLWGWAEKGESVSVELVGKGKPVDADLSAVPNEPSLRKWAITYGDLRGALTASAGLKIVITARLKKKTSRLELNDVLVGDVWVFGQKPGRGVPIRSEETEAICARAKGRLRFLGASSVNWNNPAEVITAPWSELAARPQGLTHLANVTCYFARNLLEHSGDVPIGVIAVPWDEIFRERVDSPESFTQSEDLKNGWEAALKGGGQASRDCEPILEKFRREILELKREGKVPAAPPPREIEPPARLHMGSFPSLPYAVRGGTW
jgi:hypothetical protein